MPARSSSLSMRGEFGEIARLASLLGAATSAKNILRSIGDDAAIIKPPRDQELAFTTDLLIERVHFDPRWDAPHDIGWKAIAASLSDIAAMNGKPLCAVVGLAMPSRTSTTWIDDVYRGIRHAALAYACPIVGGDTVGSPAGVTLSIAMIGAVRRSEIVYRSGAKAGDFIYVSGELGTCAAALTLLQKHRSHLVQSGSLFRKHRQPTPRFDILSVMRKRLLRPTSMIDISDGLVSELQHLSEESQVQCEIDSSTIPTRRVLHAIAKSKKWNATKLALHSGEEYELLLTVAPRHAARMNAIADLTCIGRIKRGAGVFDISSGSPLQLLPQGFKHF